MTWDKRKPRPGPGKVMVENLKEIEHAPLVSIPFHSGLCFTRLFWKWGMQVSNTWLSWAGQRLKYHNPQRKYSRNWSNATMKRLRKRSIPAPKTVEQKPYIFLRRQHGSAALSFLQGHWNSPPGQSQTKQCLPQPSDPPWMPLCASPALFTHSCPSQALPVPATPPTQDSKARGPKAIYFDQRSFLPK